MSSLFENLEYTARKEASTKVPMRAINAAILEADNQFGSFLAGEHFEARLAYVAEDIAKIATRVATENGVDPEAVGAAVTKHFASFVYEGIEGTPVSTPDSVNPTDPIGGGKRSLQDPQDLERAQKDKYKNRDVKQKQDDWLKGDGTEHQDFEYGGLIADPWRDGSPMGTNPDSPSYNPNEQTEKRDKYEMVGGDDGAATKPTKKNKGNAKEITPTSAYVLPRLDEEKGAPWNLNEVYSQALRQYPQAPSGQVLKIVSTCMGNPEYEDPNRVLQLVGSTIGRLGQGNIDVMSKHYPWEKCISDRKGEGHSQESAEKICGYIKAKNSSVNLAEVSTEMAERAATAAFREVLAGESAGVDILNDKHIAPIKEDDEDDDSEAPDDGPFDNDNGVYAKDASSDGEPFHDDRNGEPGLPNGPRESSYHSAHDELLRERLQFNSEVV